MTRRTSDRVAPLVDDGKERRQHFLIVPDLDGERARLVPIFGEAV